jgi:type I pantothenate kinase
MRMSNSYINGMKTGCWPSVNRRSKDPSSYFHHYASLSADETREIANRIWRRVNGKNLVENIGPTRGRADLIIHKGLDHSVEYLELRKI